ncbi:CLUMA_CG016663, isoform A [Clunio marinus]|uniref:CLUMA_CG016663, isoform A n=1 Tax=Clunio marinus TaxID=568069 RepID=A0A1J1ITV2_9DIPT|nr:CLUMA_CG016663, isoform A [Clunio marinus]
MEDYHCYLPHQLNDDPLCRCLNQHELPLQRKNKVKEAMMFFMVASLSILSLNIESFHETSEILLPLCDNNKENKNILSHKLLLTTPHSHVHQLYLIYEHDEDNQKFIPDKKLLFDD